MEIQVYNVATHKRVVKTHSVLSMCKTKTVDALVLVVGTPYKLVVKTLENYNRERDYRERDQYVFSLVEYPYGEDEKDMCKDKYWHGEEYWDRKRLYMKRKKRIFTNKYNSLDFEMFSNQIIFWIMGDIADCTQCDAVWLQTCLTKFRDGNKLGKDYMAEVPFFLVNKFHDVSD